MSTVESRLAQHGISVPAVAAPVAAYIPAVRSGNLVFTSGQLPMVEGELSLAGIVGDGVAEADAQRAAGVWHERGVAWHDGLVWQDRPTDLRPGFAVEGSHDYQTEIHLQSDAFVRTIAQHLQQGAAFFIDHGTGVVIGETCRIGEGVTLYQGVTLGAWSFPRDEDGQLIRGARRHPTLEDRVTVYSNATILGGTTVVGAGSQIGSSVSLNRSVPPNTIVTIERPSLKFREAA